MRLFGFIALTAAMLVPVSRACADEAISAAANSPLWHKLIGYHAPRHLLDHGHSEVTSDGFFLAEDAKRSPIAELRATLAAMRQPFDKGAEPKVRDAHALCRFPARARFIEQALDIKLADRDACPELTAWRRGGDITGASLILASGYLSNPASFYGHLLLKFNSATDDGSIGSLLDTAINYGALYPPGENPVAYIIRGVGGGYQSRFTHLDYFNHSHNYADEQLRDVWEYELNLDQAQVDLLVDHAFELMQVSHNYYFFLQNCAYRMAELVSVVLDAPMLSGDKIWIAPIDVFQRLSVKGVGGDNSYVRAVRRVPSQQNRFREDFARLPKAAQAGLRTILNNHAKPGFAAELKSFLAGLEPGDQVLAVEAGIAYFDFLKTAEKISEKAYGDRNHLLLRQRLALPPATQLPGFAGDARFQDVAPPHEGNPTSMLQATAVYNDRLGEGLELRIRPVHSDFFSLEPGTLPNSELYLFDTRLLWRNDRLTLRSLDVARITSLKTSPTGVRGDGGDSWHVRFGLQSRDLACDACLNGVVAGSWGQARQLTQDVLVYGLVGGQLLVGDNAGSELQASLTAGALIDLPAGMRLSLDGGFLQELDSDQDFLPFAGAALKVAGTRRYDIRAHLRWQESLGVGDALEGGIAFSWFW